MDKIEKRNKLGHVKGIDDQAKTITALVSTAQWDRMDERIAKGAWDLKNYLKNAVVLWAHDSRDLPIAKTISIQETDAGLEATAQFDTGSARAMDIFRLYKEKFLNAFSVGFIAKKWDVEPLQDGTDRKGIVYTDAELFEYSAVPVPANPGALVSREMAEILTKTVGKRMFKEVDGNAEVFMIVGPEEPEKPSDAAPVGSPPAGEQPPAPSVPPEGDLEKSLKYLIELSKTAKASKLEKSKIDLVQQSILVLSELVDANREGVDAESLKKLKEGVDAIAGAIARLFPDSETLIKKLMAQIDKAVQER